LALDRSKGAAEGGHLKQGDVAIQGGTRHAWRNKSSKVTTMCFVLIGAKRRLYIESMQAPGRPAWSASEPASNSFIPATREV
jgi:hypothetical protein